MLCVKQGKCFKTNSLLKYETLEREEVGETIKLKYQTPQNTLVKKIASLDLDVPSSDQLKLGTDICNVPFNFYLIYILASFLLFLSSIYREVLLLSGKTCIKLNHNCAKASAFH